MLSTLSKRDKEAKAKKSKERRKCFTSIRLTPLSFRDEERNMRKLTCQRLSESWFEATKQKVNEKLEMDIEKLKTMWQLRLKWKTNPAFSTWLEVQDPIHRHSWTPVDLHKSNIFNHYDFHDQIPDPLTRDRAETDPTYMMPRVKTLR